jgi:1-acyl-sn-glycerol-3-phosphate acyltransferase
MSEFDDIRPYNDDEMLPVFRRVIADNEFIDLIGRLKFPKFYNWAKYALRPLLRCMLARNIKKLATIFDFQRIVERYLGNMVKTTTSSFKVCGLEHLDFTGQYLFMSNHRDITLDPALTNYALFHHGGKTLRIAIGDNLLSKPFASDLMRLNKSFIVQRSITKPRELFRALNKLSRYIWHSLKVDGENVWIAHREGRAKDGIDKTEAAIIKMLTIAKPKTMAFGEYIRELKIVPVSISYELDPCDAMKAHELAMLSEQNEYIKTEHEDLESIGRGIQGDKGNVTLVFGKPLRGDYADAEAVATALDHEIIANYALQKTNLIAYALLNGDDALQSAKSQLDKQTKELADNITPDAIATFKARVNELPPQERNFILQMYANPMVNLLGLHGPGQ